MKAWERERLEYKPLIGYKTNILTDIGPSEFEGRQYVSLDYLPPILMTQRAASYLGMDAIDSLIASLSRAHDLEQQIQKSLNYNEDFQDYLSLKESDDPYDQLQATAKHEANLTDIDGQPKFDVYPLISDAKNEMEIYLDFLNDALFDGEIDYDVPNNTREKEEIALDTIITNESNGLFDLIDYDKLSSRIQVIQTAKKKTEFFKNLLDKSEEYINTTARGIFDDDLESALLELARIPDQELSKVQDLLSQSFNQYADGSLNNKYNIDRLSGQEVRETLDKQMVDVQSVMHEYNSSLGSYGNPDFEEPYGVQVIKTAVGEGLGAMRKGFEFMVVEHLSNTEQNNRQLDELFNEMNGKIEKQTLYHFVDLFANEFDKKDVLKEVDRFIRIQQL